LINIKARDLNMIPFKFGGIYEKHAVASAKCWKPSQNLLEDGGKPRKPVSSWLVAGPTQILTSSRQSGKNEMKIP
jgi:hypothetical protein